jgi:tRNA(Arg) A34 adenosine deaminase TadA
VSRLERHLRDANLNHKLVFEGGLLEPECREQLQGFFRRRRESKVL